MNPPAGKARIAGDIDAGRSCPYCRFALKPGASVVDCGGCSATHHDECWSDNGGCAVMGCAGAPAARVAGDRTRTPLPPPPPVVPPAPAPVASPPSGSRGTTVLVAAMLAVAVAVAGGALALVLSSGGADPVATPGLTTVVVTQPPPVTATVPAAPPEGTTTPAPALAPVPVASQRTADIRAVLQHYYGAVRNGDFDRAWSLLSPTYKNWKAGNGGFAKWEQQERHNRAHLRVGSLNVDVRSFDQASGVATIFVSGMRFVRPDGSLCAYEGYTWARRNGDGWLYDQGYLQNPARAAKWRPQNQLTLGYPCEPSGY